MSDLRSTDKPKSLNYTAVRSVSLPKTFVIGLRRGKSRKRLTTERLNRKEMDCLCSYLVSQGLGMPLVNKRQKNRGIIQKKLVLK